jgi:hypothetical protein
MMTGALARLLPLACAVVLFASSTARAQSAASPAAEQLYQEGNRLLAAGKVHEACEKFAASQEAEPGLGTLLHLALCHEKEGRTATAWAEYNKGVALAQNRGEKDREKFARDHARALEKQLHKIVIEVPNRPEGLEIKLDNASFPLGSLGTPIPLDPGEHRVEARAPQKKPYSHVVRLAPSAGTDRVEVPSLEDEGSSSASSVPATPTTTPASSSPSPSQTSNDAPKEEPKPNEEPAKRGSPTRRWIGVGVGTVGVALGVVAIAEAITSTSRQSTSEDLAKHAHDPGVNPVDAANKSNDAHSQAVTAQTYAIVFGAASVVALGVGVVLFATSFKGSSSAKVPWTLAPTVGRGAGGLTLTGAF